jgi:carboxypeptidase Taq
MENDWKKLEPYIDKVFASVRKIAKLKADKFGIAQYDILVDSFDPERKSSEIEEVFNNLKDNLPDLIQKIVKKQSPEKVIPLREKIDENTQREIGLRVMRAMGFDMDRGRLDKSVHPFCGGTNDDVRLTTRYDESNFLSSLLGVIHEAGHGLYQQNLPANYLDQPVGNAKGMAFHESQSLIMEKQAGKTPEFMQFLARILRDEFKIKGEEYSAENLYLLMTRVEPSLIRVDADEATYPLHVIIRFEIEKAIIDGSLKTKDLPEYWNKKMEQYLGIIPDSDKDGCMQDIHWPSGWFGYFPSYTNGAIIASMLMKAAREKHPEINGQLASGSFTGLNEYLNKNLRNYGSVKNSASLLKISTGHSKINPEIFTDYLKSKYL